MSKPPASLASLASLMPVKGAASQPEFLPPPTSPQTPAVPQTVAPPPEIPGGARRPSGMNLKLTPELSEALARLAFETGRTKQELVTEALNKAFKLR